MANLLIEIGNTALKAAWAEGITLGKTFRYQGEKVVDYIVSLTSKEKPDVLSITSVSGFSVEEISILKAECGKLLILDSMPFREDYGLPSYLGYNRAASLIASRQLFKDKDCTVFDFGTVLSVDFLSADGKYLGGNVSPGCRTRFKAMERYSKNLPLVNTPSEIQERGNSVVSSIESGVISGIMFEIGGYIAQSPENNVIFTGGDAIYFAKLMKSPIFAVCNLVLIGLAIITDDYVRKNG